MKEITTHTLNQFDKWRLFQLLKDFLEIFSKIDTAKSSEGDAQEATTQAAGYFRIAIGSVLADFEKAFNRYDEVLVAQKKAETPTQYDEERDWAVRELDTIAKTFLDHYLSQAKQRAAEFLNTQLTVYGGGKKIARLPVDKESAAITNMLQEFASDEAKEHIRALDLEQLVGHLETTNNQYIEARRNFTEENMQMAGLLKEARIEVENAWRILRTAINGYAVVFTEDALANEVIDQLNATIEEHKTAIRRSKSAQEAKDEPEGQPR